MRALFTVTALATAAAFMLAGCQAKTEWGGEGAASAPLQWLEGCWVSDEMQTVETWSVFGMDHAFGHSAMRQDGEVVFFEQMRIDRTDGEAAYTFHAYPKGVGPSSFPQTNSAQTSENKQSITFANAAHDYPQKITYARDGEALTAQISLIDDSNVNAWRFRACD